jgi:hypothetical protein
MVEGGQKGERDGGGTGGADGVEGERGKTVAGDRDGPWLNHGGQVVAALRRVVRDGSHVRANLLISYGTYKIRPSNLHGKKA